MAGPSVPEVLVPPSFGQDGRSESSAHGEGVLGGDCGGRIRTMRLGGIDPEASCVTLPTTPLSDGASVSQYQFGWDPPQDSLDSEIRFGWEPPQVLLRPHPLTAVSRRVSNYGNSPSRNCPGEPPTYADVCSGRAIIRSGLRGPEDQSEEVFPGGTPTRFTSPERGPHHRQAVASRTFYRSQPRGQGSWTRRCFGCN